MRVLLLLLFLSFACAHVDAYSSDTVKVDIVQLQEKVTRSAKLAKWFVTGGIVVAVIPGAEALGGAAIVTGGVFAWITVRRAKRLQAASY